MPRLQYPKDPTQIMQTTPLEPMQMTLDGKPCVGIRFSDMFILAMKDGEVNGVRTSVVEGKLRFLAYLAEGESVTFHGSGVEEDDPRQSEAVSTILTRQIPLPVGSRCSEVPDFVPYVILQFGRRYDSLNVPTLDGSRIALCYGQHSPDTHQMSSLRDTSEVFDGYIACTDLDRWRGHKLITGYHVVPVVQWPE